MALRFGLTGPGRQAGFDWATPSPVITAAPMRRRLSLDFLDVETLSAGVLALAAVSAVILANSPWAGSYHQFVHAEFPIQFGDWAQSRSVLKWTKDGLMAVFFLVVGLEIKHEILKGELSQRGRLALPIAAAAGGMAGPALIYLLINMGEGRPEGWPIPTATDIAFAAAALAVVGRGLPPALRTFLLTLAIVDDLGAVLLIGLLFTKSLDLGALVGAAAVIGAMAMIGRWRSAPLGLYLAGFAVLWVLTLQSGLNTSLAGVAAAAMVPASSRKPGEAAPLKSLMHALHPFVAFGILPFFAFVAAGVSFASLGPGDLVAPVSLGIMAGLVLGKPLGVLSAIWVVMSLGLGRRPSGATALELAGVALLCGIGFTMSLFIGGLAFSEADMRLHAQVQAGVLGGSLLSILAGGTVLWVAARRRKAQSA